METSRTTKLRDDFRSVAVRYVERFERKYSLKLEFWVADDVGGVACFGDWFFSFDDIRYDIDHRLNENVIMDWHQANVDQGARIGLIAWSKGFRHKDI